MISGKEEVEVKSKCVFQIVVWCEITPVIKIDLIYLYVTSIIKKSVI